MVIPLRPKVGNARGATGLRGPEFFGDAAEYGFREHGLKH